MKLKIEIEMDNAVFEYDPGRLKEVKRILYHYLPYVDLFNPDCFNTIVNDINGNKVGKIKVVEDNDD